MDRQKYFEKLHEKLAKQYHLTDRQVQRIRQYSINTNTPKDRIVNILLDKVNNTAQMLEEMIRRKIENEEIIRFLQNCSDDDFIDITKKYL